MSLLKKIGIGIGAFLAFLLVASLFFVWYIGAWRLVFPNEDYETVPPEIAADWGDGSSLRVLLYTKTNAFRHSEGIEASRALIDEVASRRGWAVFHTENSAVFDATHLGRFDVVVFSSASGNHASDEQDAAFRAWLEGGGGWVGIHAAGDGSHDSFTWYAENLRSGKYLGHIMGPQTQEARVVVEARDHPVTRGLPAEFKHSEEWYSWDRGAREAGFDVLLTVDESSYEPFIRRLGQEVDISMKDHPVVWSRCVGTGRAVYSAMGHWGEAYQQDYTKRLLENAIEWASGATAAPCGASSAAR